MTITRTFPTYEERRTTILKGVGLEAAERIVSAAVELVSDTPDPCRLSRLSMDEIDVLRNLLQEACCGSTPIDTTFIDRAEVRAIRSAATRLLRGESVQDPWYMICGPRLIARAVYDHANALNAAERERLIRARLDRSATSEAPECLGTSRRNREI